MGSGLLMVGASIIPSPTSTAPERRAHWIPSSTAAVLYSEPSTPTNTLRNMGSLSLSATARLLIRNMFSSQSLQRSEKKCEKQGHRCHGHGNRCDPPQYVRHASIDFLLQNSAIVTHEQNEPEQRWGDQPVEDRAVVQGLDGVNADKVDRRAEACGERND